MSIQDNNHLDNMNQEDESLFYNPTYKIFFLDKHKDKIQDYNFYKRLFVNSKEKEEQLHRDLCDFSRKDINEIISSMRPSTSAAAAKNIAMIKRYLNHAAYDGEKLTNIIQLSKLTDEAVKFVPSNPKYYISEYELQIIEDSCINPQDAFLFRAMFEGISGSEMIELRNLKISNIDADNNLVTIDLENHDKNRTVRVSERFIDLALKAYDQKVYVLNNGEELSEDFRRANADYELEPSDYILKKSNIGRIKRDEPVTNPTLYKRLSIIKSFQSFKTIDKYYLKFNNIYKSGAIWYAAKYIEEKKKDIKAMQASDWAEVMRHVKNVYLDLPVDPKNIVNKENIEALYEDKGKIVS